MQILIHRTHQITGQLCHQFSQNYSHNFCFAFNFMIISFSWPPIPPAPPPTSLMHTLSNHPTTRYAQIDLKME